MACQKTCGLWSQFKIINWKKEKIQWCCGHVTQICAFYISVYLCNFNFPLRTWALKENSSNVKKFKHVEFYHSLKFISCLKLPVSYWDLYIRLCWKSPARQLCILQSFSEWRPCWQTCNVHLKYPSALELGRKEVYTTLECSWSRMLLL